MMLDTQLAQLDSAQIIRRLDEPDIAYLFKHALTQETAYASLLKKTRRDVHLRVAQAYEQAYAERLDDYAALLAQHYAAADDDPKTIQYATRAGDASARIFANTEAVAYYSLAIEAGKRIGATVHELYLKRGRALELLTRYQDALTSYEEMEWLARERQDHALELASLVARTTLFSTHTPLYDVQRATDFSNRSLDFARRIGDRFSEARILWTQMLFQIFGSGDAQAGVDLGEQSLKILRELMAQPRYAQDMALREQLAYTLNDFLYAYIQVGNLERGLTARLEARDLWRQLDNRPMLADNLAGLAFAQLTYGDVEPAMANAEEAFTVAESASNAWSMAQGKTMKGYALLELGRFSEAFRFLQAGNEYATAAQTGGAMLAARCGLATHYGMLGMHARGLEYARHALEGAIKFIPDWHLWPHAVLIRLHLARGEMALAQRMADESGIELPDRKIFRAFMPGVAAVVLAEIELALAKNNLARALEIADAELGYFKGSAPNYLPDLYLAHAKIFLGQGNAPHARREFQNAFEATNKARRMRWQVLGALTQFERAHGRAEDAARWADQARAEVGFISQNLDAEMRAVFLDLASVRQVL